MCQALVQYCFFPRMMHSAKDALYTFNFFKLLHKLKVPNYNILNVLGAILKCLVPVMHCCSEQEAECLGIFFTELFCLLNHWTKLVNWNRECKSNLAFSRNFGGDQTISFEEFEGRIVENMNKRFAQSLMQCFDKSDKMYMKARCSLLILNRMSIVFPKTETVATAIQRKLQALVDAKDEIKMDLWTLAGRCNENLRKKIESFPQVASKPKV
jgi:THO complex subunit 2